VLREVTGSMARRPIATPTSRPPHFLIENEHNLVDIPDRRFDSSSQIASGAEGGVRNHASCLGRTWGWGGEAQTALFLLTEAVALAMKTRSRVLSASEHGGRLGDWRMSSHTNFVEYLGAGRRAGPGWLKCRLRLTHRSSRSGKRPRGRACSILRQSQLPPATGTTVRFAKRLSDARALRVRESRANEESCGPQIRI